MKRDILLDTNIVIRLLVRDNEEHFIIAEQFFEDLEQGKTSALLLEIIIGEIIYVLRSVYKQNKSLIKSQLELLFTYDNLHIENQYIIQNALDIYVRKNIDFADAILCAKKNLEGYEVMSFDKDIKKC
jgi:predicted nucleic-acid-binding protein